MRELKVQVKDDHLVRLTKVKKPLLAVAELIWNGFDADADTVKIDIQQNEIGGIDYISVVDNGHGISYPEATSAFGSLGGSWKQRQGHSKKQHRILHGKAGKGRFRAFSLGDKVEWSTTYKDNGNHYKYKIKGNILKIGTFFLTDQKVSSSNRDGTTVRITNITKNFQSLDGDIAIQEITEHFALYLNEYPGINLFYNGLKIDPSSMIECSKTYELSKVKSNKGISYKAHLTVIEWNKPTDRSIYLCDKDGFSYDKDNPKIHAPGFNFTAYIKSDYIKELAEEKELTLKDMNSVLQNLLAEVRSTLKDHFRERQAEQATNLVATWKDEHLYPYDGDPRDIIEETERQVFDICALNINQYLPGFEFAENASKKLSFALIKQALKENPKSLRKILSSVLELPIEKQDDLANLLEKATLASIINASKIVTDRLDFLKGLEFMLFDPISRDQLLERSQLHRILADNTWIFGEEFNLSADDESLTAVLKKHLQLLGKDRFELAPVVRADNSEGIVDLMLSRVIPQPKETKLEHIVIELKRPKTEIKPKECDQIESYAYAVAHDERFKDTDTKWNFFVVSNDIRDDAARRCNQRYRPPGLLYDDPDGKYNVWVKRWSSIIETANARLSFFQKKLEYNATMLSGRENLKKTHEKYLPKRVTCTT